MGNNTPQAGTPFPILDFTPNGVKQGQEAVSSGLAGGGETGLLVSLLREPVCAPAVGARPTCGESQIIQFDHEP